MGAFYSFGNMSTYMTSYMRQNGSPHITYTGNIYLHDLLHETEWSPHITYRGNIYLDDLLHETEWLASHYINR